MERLRARTALLGTWAHRHPGLYKVPHESTLNRRTDMSFKNGPAERTTAAIQRCMDAGLASAFHVPAQVVLDAVPSADERTFHLGDGEWDQSGISRLSRIGGGRCGCGCWLCGRW